ncbi:hypothetical protein ABMA27_015174 [Loxostege sticticalis]|uniref:EF-hand domain-containing protein n=1 Tax=Loxostege sticticalis TaxID=481309 RepID=A0ABR3I6N3_LOXSC
MDSMECYDTDDMYLGKARTSSNIAWHRPMSTTFREEEQLMQRSARELAHTRDPLEKLRLLCLSHGACGIMRLSRIFRRIHGDGDKHLNEHQFVNMLKKTALDFSEEDAKELFKRFANNSGYVSLDDFMIHIRPPMPDARRAKVEQAFNKLDRNGDGVISVEDIRKVYAVTSDPKYMNGEESTDQIMNKFLANFEQENIVDGKVTREEFMNYYNGVSVSIDNDCYFDLMMRQQFKL